MKIKFLLVFLLSLSSATATWAQDESEAAASDSSVMTEVPSEGQAEAATDLFARDTYRIDSLICPFKGDIDYEPGDIECGLLQVPENRENPDSRMIELHFVKLSSRWGHEDFEDLRDEDALEWAEGMADGKRDDPVIYLTGGPGSPVNYYVKRFKDHTLLDYRDLYILEQRGIVNSGDFCRFFGGRKPEASDVATWEEYQETDNVARADCFTNAAAAGVDLTGYNTIENARDVKALRRALGFENWNVWGISYGSILGQAYIKEDPEGIRALAIDAIMPLDIQGTKEHWRILKWFVRDLDKLQEICQSQPDCAKHYPDIPGRLREAVETVLKQPIEVEVKDTEVFPSGKVRIFADIAALLPFTLFYEQDNYPALPGFIYAWADALERRDEALFKTIAGAAGQGGFGERSPGMQMAVLCNDGDVQAQGLASQRDMEEFPIFGQVLGTKESNDRDTAQCLELGIPMRPASDYTAVQTDIPSLIIEGDMDPITPPPNAKAILPGFSNGTYVEFPYAGHGPSRSVQCSGHMLNRFYDDPAAGPDMSCPESMEEPELWAPMYTTDFAPRLAAVFFEDKKNLVIPGAWAGGSILISLIAFLMLTLAPVGRWLNKRSASNVGRTRWWAWLTATCSVTALAVLGAAIAATFEASEPAILFALVPWAKYGAWLGLITGLLGLVTIIKAVKGRHQRLVTTGSMLGFVLTGAAAIGLSSFLSLWGLGPF